MRNFIILFVVWYCLVFKVNRFKYNMNGRKKTYIYTEFQSENNVERNHLVDRKQV